MTINREGTAVTFTVENIPGAALPNAGGPGTRLIHFLGIILAGFAGLGLVMKKRRKMVYHEPTRDWSRKWDQPFLVTKRLYKTTIFSFIMTFSLTDNVYNNKLNGKYRMINCAK